MEPRSPSLRDLVTILYQPRETMRRILDSGADRWAIPMVVLASLCTTVNDSDWHHIGDVLPGLTTLGSTAITALALILWSASWVVVFFIASGFVMLVGRFLGGTARAADVRAAIAWGFAVTVWSVFLRIPIAIYQTHFRIPRHAQGSAAVMDVIAQGGCALAVAVLAMQLIVFAGWLVLTSFAIAEAERVSTAKGFATVGIALIGPIVMCAAAVFAFHR